MTTSAESPPRRAGSLPQRAYGALLLGCGLVAMIAPLGAGGWALAILGLVLVVAGAAEIVHALRMRASAATSAAYLTGVLMILSGLLLFARPLMVIGGLLALLAFVVAADGLTRIVRALRGPGDRRAGGLSSTAA